MYSIQIQLHVQYTNKVLHVQYTNIVTCTVYKYSYIQIVQYKDNIYCKFAIFNFLNKGSTTN